MTEETQPSPQGEPQVLETQTPPTDPAERLVTDVEEPIAEIGTNVAQTVEQGAHLIQEGLVSALEGVAQKITDSGVPGTPPSPEPFDVANRTAEEGLSAEELDQYSREIRQRMAKRIL